MQYDTVRLYGFRVGVAGGAVNGLAGWETGGKGWGNEEQEVREVGLMWKWGRCTMPSSREGVMRNGVHEPSLEAGLRTALACRAGFALSGFCRQRISTAGNAEVALQLRNSIVSPVRPSTGGRCPG